MNKPRKIPKSELERKFEEASTLVSGLIKMTQKAAGDCNNGTWGGLGSLGHIRNALTDLLLGFEYRGTEEDVDTIKRIESKAREYAKNKVDMRVKIERTGKEPEVFDIVGYLARGMK